MRNPEETRTDDVEKLLSDQKSLEDKLAKLGYQPNSGKPKRSHHKTASRSLPDTRASKGKTKA